MPNKRKRHTPEFKAKVSLDAIKGMKTASELASQYQVHPVQISTWKKQAIEHLPEAFKRNGSTPQPPTEQALTAPLYEEIGRLKNETIRRTQLNVVDKIFFSVSYVVFFLNLCNRFEIRECHFMIQVLYVCSKPNVNPEPSHTVS